MKFLILAAGSGTRLGKQTEFLPKSLIRINKKTILERQLNIIKKNQKNNVVIIAGPNKEKFLEFQVDIFEDVEYKKHEQLGSLASINKIFDEDVIVVFSDIIFDEGIVKEIIKTECDFGIALDQNWREKYIERTDHPISQADLVEIKDGKIRQIKKNLQGKDNSEFIGIVKFSSYGWKILIQLYNKLKENHEGSFHDANGFDDAYITDIIQELIELDYNIKPIFVKGNWLEIDTTQDLEIASKKLD
jgi:choline kinase